MHPIRTGELQHVLLRNREDGDIDLITFGSREPIGRFQRVVAPPVVGLVSLSLCVLIVALFSGYMVWQVGRHYGQQEAKP